MRATGGSGTIQAGVCAQMARRAGHRRDGHGCSCGRLGVLVHQPPYICELGVPVDAGRTSGTPDPCGSVLTDLSLPEWSVRRESLAGLPMGLLMSCPGQDLVGIFRARGNAIIDPTVSQKEAIPIIVQSPDWNLCKPLPSQERQSTR